jgi:bacillithiol system protein YtxJ
VPKSLVEMQSLQEFNEALQESFERPVLLFKHSLTCPISTRAFNELQSYLSKADGNVSYRLIKVQNSYAVSNEVASKLHLEHASPQAILVRNGRGVWNASHFDITISSLEEAIRNCFGGLCGT